MEWQAIGIAVQIMLIATGWVLFQRARGELSARAAETPVLAEVKALEQNVKQLLGVIEEMADKQSTRIEVLNEVEGKIREAEELRSQYENIIARAVAVKSAVAAYTPSNPATLAVSTDQARVGGPGSDASSSRQVAVQNKQNLPAAAVASNEAAASRRELDFNMADSGESPAAIAGAARLSEGEVETLLGLRVQR